MPKAPCRRPPFMLAAATAIAAASPALAQRADENAVTGADDAFGFQVGAEVIGLYAPGAVRGFSALDAGNVRVDGLYVDRQANFTAHLVSGTAIRVGAAAQGYRLPAPTGIVDVSLRKAGDTTVVSPAIGYGPYGNGFAEVDAQLRVNPALGIAAGVGVYNDAFVSGADRASWSAAVLPRLTFGASEIIPFWGRIEYRDFEPTPLVAMARGADAPRPPAARPFAGPDWADASAALSNSGVLADLDLGDGWGLRTVGLRSVNSIERQYVDLYAEAQADGSARRLLIADPAQRFASTSGELVLARRLVDGERLHLLSVALRGRDQFRRYGGSDALDLGPAVVGRPIAVAERAFTAGAQSRDRVRQATMGIAYRGQQAGLGSVDLGLQRADYSKRVRQPGAAQAVRSDDVLWLPSAALTAVATPRLSLFASYTRGLEEGDVAPASARNKDAAPPAVRTSQADAGLAYELSDGLRLVGAAFEVKKPYFGLDENAIYGRRGTVRHRGIELSVAGRLMQGVNLVAGGVLLRPRVSGEDVARGAIGARPAGRPDTSVILNLDYRPAWASAFSADLGVSAVGERTAGPGNRTRVAGRTTVDLGARYRFRVGRAPATLRLLVANIFDNVSWDVDRAGILQAAERRRAVLTLTADL